MIRHSQSFSAICHIPASRGVVPSDPQSNTDVTRRAAGSGLPRMNG
jgi:hypothetical protein